MLANSFNVPRWPNGLKELVSSTKRHWCTEREWSCSKAQEAVDFVLGAILELVYLLLWLVPYGVIQIVRSRRRTTSRVTT